MMRMALLNKIRRRKRRKTKIGKQPSLEEWKDVLWTHPFVDTCVRACVCEGEGEENYIWL